MNKLFSFILLLVFLQNLSFSQSELVGTYTLTSQKKLEYLDEYTFSDGNSFKYTRLKHHGNECGKGEYTITDTVLTLKFHEVSLSIVDSLRSHCIINESKTPAGDTCEYVISVLDHNESPLQGASAQLVDENGFNIVDKIKKYWETDAAGNVTVSFSPDVELYGIKIANMGYETLVIPVKKDADKTITVKMLELDKCFYVVEGGTVKTFYLKNVRYSGFYMRDENSSDYHYFKKEK